MADSCCIVELKEIIEKLNVELSQSRAKISELEAKVREQEEENTRLTRDLKEIRRNRINDGSSSCSDESDSDENQQNLSIGSSSSCSDGPDSDDSPTHIRRNPNYDGSFSCSDGSDSDEHWRNPISDSSPSCSDGPDSDDSPTHVRHPQIKESSDAALNINSMPEEIFIKIFGYLSHNDLGRTAQVCRRWKVLTKSPILWKKVDVEFSPSHESQTDIAKSFVNRLPPCVSSLSLNFAVYDDWKELLYFEKFCIILKQKCPHLERLILDNAFLSDALPIVVDLCSRHLQNIKVLVFRFCLSPDGPARIKYGAISKIERLDVSCCDFGYIPFSRMPNLKRLFLEDPYVNDSMFENETSFFNQLHILNLAHSEISSRTFQAIQNHAFNLQELYLCFTDIKDDDISSNNSMFQHLKIICLVHCRGVTSNGVVSLIQSCQSLENVYVDEEVAESYAVHPTVVNNSYMLEIVKGRGIIHSHYFSHK